MTSQLSYWREIQIEVQNEIIKTVSVKEHDVLKHGNYEHRDDQRFSGGGVSGFQVYWGS